MLSVALIGHSPWAARSPACLRPACGWLGAGLVLVNGGDNLTVPADATSFTFPTAVAFTSSYSVTVAAQPVGQSCAATEGTGAMLAANVMNVSIICSSEPYTLGGSISGLNGAGLVLANGANTVTVAPNATGFTLPGRQWL